MYIVRGTGEVSTHSLFCLEFSILLIAVLKKDSIIRILIVR